MFSNGLGQSLVVSRIQPRELNVYHGPKIEFEQAEILVIAMNTMMWNILETPLLGPLQMQGKLTASDASGITILVDVA